MDMSGKFDIAAEAVASDDILRALAGFADRASSAPRTAVAWRDGLPITVDLTQPLPADSQRVWPEHIAIAALFVSTFVFALIHLRF